MLFVAIILILLGILTLFALPGAGIVIGVIGLGLLLAYVINFVRTPSEPAP